MPSRVFSTVFRTLGKLYNFPDSRSAPTAVELDLPVQLVHDIRRDAVMGAGTGPNFGYHIVTASQGHVGTGGITDTIVLSTALGQNGWEFDPSTMWAWFMDSWASHNNSSNFTQLRIMSVISGDGLWVGPSDSAALDPVDQLLAFYEGSEGTTTVAKSTHTARRPALLTATAPTISFVSFCSGACTVDCNALIWVGPIGVVPGFLSG